MVKRTLEEMNLIDDFLMTAVAADEESGAECCRIILSVLLEREIGEVHVIAQRAIQGLNSELRGIRMDVEICEKDGSGEKPYANVYDLEPHTRKDTDFPRANRFRQAKVDGRYMKSGDNDFKHLPDLYIITITNFDIFGQNQRIYTFRNSCEELPELVYHDGVCHIYFNTSGKIGGSKSIENMLNFIQKSKLETVADSATQKLEEHVRKVKMDPELRRSIMTFGDIIDYERREEREETEKRVTREVTKNVTESVTQDNILSILSLYGGVPETLKERLHKVKDPEVLRLLIPEAARAGSMDAFLKILDERKIPDAGSGS